MKLQPDNEPRSSLGIGLGLDDVVGPRREFARRFAKRIGKLTRSTDIVYPCIPDLDGEDEGGQLSFSLAVSTRWISTAKLLQSNLTTLTQREGRE
ncbi:hypothetical protein BHM03_00061422 [Ensete ventricosum]|nr:hypothetical protein BHM03_00061422 [Ensete ventricosum]